MNYQFPYGVRSAISKYLSFPGLRVLVLAGSISLLSSCGGGSSDDASSYEADLQGMWVGQECRVVDENESAHRMLTFNGTSLTQSVVLFYGNETCAGEVTVTTSLAATIFVSGLETELSNAPAKHIDVFYSKAYITGSDAYVTVLEASGTTLQDALTAQGVEDIDNIPVTVYRDTENAYSIYRVTDGSLRIGASDTTNDGTVEALRFNRLGTEMFVKQ